jgi:hypothetical protein
MYRLLRRVFSRSRLAHVVGQLAVMQGEPLKAMPDVDRPLALDAP